MILKEAFNLLYIITSKYYYRIAFIKLSLIFDLTDINNGENLLIMKIIFLLLVTFFLKTITFGQIDTNNLKISKQVKEIDTTREIEKSAFFLYNGIAYNKKNFAIFLWGKKVKVIGITSFKKAIQLWEEINKRELTKPEKKSLERGFESKD